MESYLQENFGVKPNHSSTEALEKWRNLYGVVRNRKRRFRFTANLSKRYEAAAMRRTNQEKLRVAVLVSKAAIQFLQGVTPSEYNVPPEVKAAAGFQVCAEELGSITEGHDVKKLKFHGGVTGIAEKLSTSISDGLTTNTDLFTRRQEIYGLNQFAESEPRSFLGNDSMEDETLSVVVFDGNETHQSIDLDTSKKVTLKWIIVVFNFILELSSVIFDQLPSQLIPHHALIALLTALAALVICVIELVHKGRNEKVTWKLYWFYHPSPSHRPFGTFKDIFMLVCATSQVISAAISYTFYCLHVHNPIKLSIISVVIAASFLCSNFCNDHDKVT